MTLTYSEPYVDREIAYSLAGMPAHVVAEKAGIDEAAGRSHRERHQG